MQSPQVTDSQQDRARLPFVTAILCNFLPGRLPGVLREFVTVPAEDAVRAP